jgi:ribose-phosphate pyrophosphokinase
MTSSENEQGALIAAQIAAQILKETSEEDGSHAIPQAAALQLVTMFRVLAQEVNELKDQVATQADQLRDLEVRLETKYTFCCGTGNVPLAQKVADILGCELDNTMELTRENPSTRVFADGEFRPIIRDTLRGKVAILFQSPSPAYEFPPGSGQYTFGINDEIKQLKLMINACVSGDVKEIILIIPRFPYARQDRKSQPREPNSVSQLIRELIFNGADHIFSLDLHSKQSTGATDKPFDAPYSSYVLVPRLQKYLKQEQINPDEVVFLSPDSGGATMNSKYSDMVAGHKNIAIVHKSRDPITGEVEIRSIAGNVQDKVVIIVDDEIGSAGTLCQAAKTAHESGAKKVIAVGVHGMFHPDKGDKQGALERLRQSHISRVITTDTIDHRPEVLAEVEKPDGMIEIVSVAPLIAETIRRILSGEETSELIIPTNGD